MKIKAGTKINNRQMTPPETRQQKYKRSPKGKAAQSKARAKYLESEKGQDALLRARAKHEASEARKAYRREWMRKYRARLKEQANESP